LLGCFDNGFVLVVRVAHDVLGVYSARCTSVLGVVISRPG
jgi:hypothetical protein